MTIKETEIINNVSAKFPEQARSLESFLWAGWKFDGFGANDSIDIKRKSEVMYIRTDGIARY